MCEITGDFPEKLINKVQNCSGAVGSGDALVNYWAENDCLDAYSQVLNTTFPPTGPPILAYNPQGQQEIQGCVNQLFNTYLETKSLTDNITSPQYSSFQNTLLELCTDDTLPGVCGKFLDNYCEQNNRASTINSPTLTNFCGCYVPPDELYLKYTTPPPGGQPACDPLCHRALTSQKAVDTTGEIIRCNQNVCVIDNVIVQGNSDTIPGGINFDSICAGCGAPPADGSVNPGCLCIVSGINIADTLGNIGIGENVNMFCGANSVCIVQDANGNVISEGACSNNQSLTVPTFSSAPSWGLVILIVILVIIIFFACLAERFANRSAA